MSELRHGDKTDQQQKTFRNQKPDLSNRVVFDGKEKLSSITLKISKSAGVSVGAFYHYFKSKNDIFRNLPEADRYFEEHVAV